MSRNSIEDDILSNLNKFFGYKTLRSSQLTIITKILENNDIMVCKETGFGKSLCFQLAGLMKFGVTIIISPLPSRVEDECNKLASFTKIKCAYLYTENQPDQMQDLRNVLIKKNKVLEELRNLHSSGLKFLYVTIDYFVNSSRLKHILVELYQRNLINAIVIDEVHCVTQWIHLFEIDYSSLGSLRDLFSNIPFVFCSGPISNQSLAMIEKTLHLKNPFILNEPAVKENLLFKVMYKGENFPTSRLIDYIKNTYQGKSGLIYCDNKENCLKLSKALEEKEIQSFYYHSEISDNDKVYLNWMSTYGIAVICISGANLDINLQKIDYVVHLVIPNSLEIYMQEAAKANKNADHGDCIMFYSMDDCDLNLRTTTSIYTDKINRANNDNKKQLGNELQMYRRNIYDVVVYAENTSICRQVFLLKYFNENSAEIPCGVCDVCTIMEDGFIIDMSHILRKILMSIWSINRHQKANTECELFFTATVENVIAALLGRVEQRHCESWLVKEWFFGSFASWDNQVLHRFLYVLLSYKYLRVNHVFNEKFEAFQNLIITPKGQEFVKSNTELTITFSRKDTSFTKWLNVDWIKDQYKKDLDGVVLYHSLHSDLQRVSEWHGPYIAHLFHSVPDTWDKFKDIKFKYMQNEKSDFDEDLYTVCLIYHQIFKKLEYGLSGAADSQLHKVRGSSNLRVNVARKF